MLILKPEVNKIEWEDFIMLNCLYYNVALNLHVHGLSKEISLCARFWILERKMLQITRPEKMFNKNNKKSLY